MSQTAAARFLSATLLSAALASCSLAPHYHRPDIETPPAFKEADGWITAEPADAAPRGKWWTIFDDPQLDALEEKVSESNQDLKVALARYEEARAAARAARADYFPTITGNAQDARERSSPNFSSLSTGKPFNDYNMQADFIYEIDLWGRVRNEVAAAQNLSKASGADYVACLLYTSPSPRD